MSQNIILLFGGQSDERLVSVASAQAMAQAINPAKLWFWHNDGSVYAVTLDRLLEHENPFTNEFDPGCSVIFPNIAHAINHESTRDQVFLLAVHGGLGENGELQAMLEAAHRSYTGSCAQSSRRAFDKIATKELLASYQIKMAPHRVLEINRHPQIEAELLSFFDTHGPTIVKPVCGGSSIGCYFVNAPSDVKDVSQKIMNFSMHPFMLERVIRGREITVGVIETDMGPKALPCTEIAIESDRTFDYDGKYLGKGTKEITPADLNENQSRDAQRMAEAAHAALLLDGYSRTDMILSKDGLYYLETNTLPGLTKQSLVPQQLAACGISMREFLHAQIDLARKRKI